MPIILNQEEESLKYDLLKESLRDQVGFKINKNYTFSMPKQTFYQTKFPPRFLDHQISDWNNDSDPSDKHKTKLQRFLLPQMKNRRKSKNIQQLSRQLLKYEQFNSDQNSDHQKFRLTILKQMTKINFKRQAPIKQAQSPKKINIKLQFPQRYERYQLQNQQMKERRGDDIFKNSLTEEMTGSFYVKKSSRGLIPSIKKLVSSSFPKKSIFRSESERDPYQRKKLIMSKEEWENAQKSITDEIQQKFMEQQKAERERKVKLGRVERRLPINFLSYSHRKQSIDKEEQNEGKKRKKSPYLSQLQSSSFYFKKEKGNEEQVYEHKRLSECIFMNIKKKREEV